MAEGSAAYTNALALVVPGGSGGGEASDVASTASGGTGGGGGGGSGEREQYYKIYRAIAQVLGIPFNTKIAALAFKNRQPGSGFLALTRKLDPKYLRTNDFKNRAASYVAKWNEILPWRKVDYNDMKRFVRGEWSTERLEQYIMTRPAFKKAYPYFEYGKDDFRTYLAHEQALRTSFASAGIGDLTRRRQELFHKLDMTPSDVDQRIEELISGHDALDMMYGNRRQPEPRGGRVDQYIFNTPGNLQRRMLLQSAVKIQQGFNQSEETAAQVRRDERGRIIQTGI